MRICAVPVVGIEPYQGWVLCEYPEEDGDGFTTPGYVARGKDRDVFLPVSRFRFSPTFQRFAALVDMRFARSPRGNWTDDQLDSLIAARLAA